MLKLVNFIGCGRLGKTIGKLLFVNQVAKISGIVNTSFENALASAEFIGDGLACSSIHKLQPADIYFITARDDIIQSTCELLTTKKIFKPGSIVVHCSGSLSSKILESAKTLNCSVASIHPLKSFANPEASVKSFSGSYCAVEGDEEAVTVLTQLFIGIGGNVFNIDNEAKPIYHAAGVLANNYLVTLHYQAAQCFKATGIKDDISKKIVSMLMKDALNNLKNEGYDKALTGPIQRGDSQTISRHINALEHFAPLKNTYSVLGLATLPLTSHTFEKKQELEEILIGETISKPL